MLEFDIDDCYVPESIETPIEVNKMFEICVDSDGYYTSESTENIVEVYEMPEVENIKHLFAYKYSPEEKILELDNEKLEVINQEINKEIKIPTQLERLEDLETAFLELSSLILKGGI